MPKFPPGPSDGCFGLRLMSRMRRDVLGTYRWLHSEYGDHVSFRVGPSRLFIFFHPDQVRELLVTQAKGTVRSPRVMATFAQWNGSSILIVEGDQWVRQRRLVQPAFHPRRYDGYAQTIVTATERRADSWAAEVQQKGYCDWEANAEMTNLAMEIICRALFDIDPRREATELASAVQVLSEVAFYEMQSPLRMPNWWPSSFHRRKRWAIKVLDEFAWGLVRARRAEGKDHGDLLSMLLTAVDEDGHSRLTDEQVRNESLTLMLAGHDTSAAALDWAWFLLATHPEIAQQCQKEIEAVLGDRLPTAADVAGLAYIEAVIKESLRLYPPAIGVFLRQAEKDLVMGGYAVPRGSLLTLSSVVTQRDLRWFPNPDRFEPERFLPPRSEHILAGSYFPFGLGPRVCIGQAFAMTEMVLVVTTLLRRFDVSITPGGAPPVPAVHVALRPRDPLWLRWRDRS